MSQTNGVMMQCFHWYTDASENLWQRLADMAGELAGAGVTSVWLPPAGKAVRGAEDVGYGVYDLYDLGEFDQKGSLRTKYGTRDEYLAAIRALQGAGVQVYADIVFNHRMGADEEEDVQARRVDPNDRRNVSDQVETVRAWTRFTFAGRGGKYSDMQWRAEHFNAFDLATDEGVAIYLIDGKAFAEAVDEEFGNYDFLMGANVDTANPQVRDELLRWGHWFLDTTGVDGFRFDAAKHVEAGFFLDWLHQLRTQRSQNLFAVGEYWSYKVEDLHQFIEQTKGQISLFDAPLHLNFHLASQQGQDYDLRTIFDNTLVQQQPALAVTLVENHDSQPLQSLESVVEPWFKPLAYALILLRAQGYPCVFLADHEGAHYRDLDQAGNEQEIWLDRHQFLIDRYLQARQRWAYGEQVDHFESANLIGWTRRGDAGHPGGMAALIANADGGNLRMQLEPGRRYRDLTDHIDTAVTTDDDGWADFACPPGSVAVWVPAD